MRPTYLQALQRRALRAFDRYWSYELPRRIRRYRVARELSRADDRAFDKYETARRNIGAW